MKSLFFLLLLALFPAAIFSQDIELGGTDLNGGDILDWNTPPLFLTAPSAKMVRLDSLTLQSYLTGDPFYTEVTKILKASGFEAESGNDFKKSGLKALKTMHGVDYEIIITYYAKIFHSSTLLNNARVTIYASAAGSELNPADLKSLDKTKDDLAKQMKNLLKQGKPSASLTPDEMRVVNQFSRRALPAMNLIDGINTLQMVTDKSKMQKEEVAEIFAFMIGKGFAHVAKTGN